MLCRARHPRGCVLHALRSTRAQPLHLFSAVNQPRPVCTNLCLCDLQGTLFLNRRYFVLDRLSRRLYVFTSDIDAHPRYRIDFAVTRCTVTGGGDGAGDDVVSMELTQRASSASSVELSMPYMGG